MNLFKPVFIILICSASVSQSIAINDTIVNLFTKLNSSKPAEKAIILNQIAKHYQDFNFTKAVYYSEQAIESAKLVNDSTELANAYYNLGYIQLLKGDNSQANINLTKAYNLYNLLSNKLGIAKSSDNLASLFRYASSYDKSLKYHTTALNIFIELNDTTGIIGSKNNLGILYRNLDNYQKSLSYYHEALKLAKKTNSKLLSTVYNSIGSYYWYKESYDSALFYYRRALNINPRTLLLKERNSAALNNIGNVYRSTGKSDSALYYYKKSLDSCTRYELNNLASITLKNFGIIYNKLGNYDEALKYLDKSVSKAKMARLKRTISEDYLHLSESYSRQGNYKNALEYYKKYSNLRDSILYDEQVNKITLFEAESVLQQKEIDNANLSKNIAEQKLRINRISSLLIISCLIIGLLAVIAFTFYRNSKKR
ncbi:MAG: tetratricopeptide repeat protein [Bacteroidales bacterium]|nr:MAG: tetratricopeptide repeat protein [Bacteroidales bacterium]